MCRNVRECIIPPHHRTQIQKRDILNVCLPFPLHHQHDHHHPQPTSFFFAHLCLCNPFPWYGMLLHFWAYFLSAGLSLSSRLYWLCGLFLFICAMSWMMKWSKRRRKRMYWIYDNGDVILYWLVGIMRMHAEANETRLVLLRELNEFLFFYFWEITEQLKGNCYVDVIFLFLSLCLVRPRLARKV